MKIASARLRLAISLVAVSLLAAMLAACGGSSSPKLSKVFSAVPWTGNEEIAYTIVDQGGNLRGNCDLKTVVDSKPGQTTLEQSCTSAGPTYGDRYRDDRTAVVESDTLRPLNATRTTLDTQKNDRTTFSSTYDGAQVKFQADDNGTLHGTNRDLPKPTEKSPDPGYYDDEELFWVIRGIPLQQDWEGAYIDVNASNGQTVTARLRVQGQEEVKVPAGTFSAWRILLKTSSVTQLFWVDVNAPHAVVQANIEDTTYKLVSAS